MLRNHNVFVKFATPSLIFFDFKGIVFGYVRRCFFSLPLVNGKIYRRNIIIEFGSMVKATMYRNTEYFLFAKVKGK